MGSTGTRIEEKKQLQTLTAQNDPANLELIQKVRDDIDTLLYRSRLIWLPASNKNTKFFHQRASQRCRKNNIDGFMDEEGRWCTSDAERREWLKGISKGFSLLQNPLKWTWYFIKWIGLSHQV